MSFIINRKNYGSIQEFVKQGRGCATLTPNHYQIKRNDERIAALRQTGRSDIEIEIPIRFIHIYDRDQLLITPEQRVLQVQVLNDAYSPYGIRFTYSEDDVIEETNQAWYGMDINSAEEREAKETLGADSKTVLNFYTAGLSSGLLGWATFPWEREGDPKKDGVVILNGTLPGGITENFNLGKTAVHEIGHWLGLYHTFQGGCDAYGDHVGDTPAHAAPNYGKPEEGRLNACPMENADAPVHNYMNYVDDEWMTEFTDGQITRVRDHVRLYRSEFIVLA